MLKLMHFKNSVKKFGTVAKCQVNGRLSYCPDLQKKEIYSNTHHTMELNYMKHAMTIVT